MDSNKKMTLTGFFSEKKSLLVQFIKFGLVGVSNTAISYLVEMLGYYVLFADVSWNSQTKILAATALAFIISVTNSYYWNQKYVFQSKGKITLFRHLKMYGKTVASYGITGLVLAPCLKLWLNAEGVPFWAASLCSLCVTIPLNFVLNKLWAFRDSAEAGKKKNV